MEWISALGALSPVVAIVVIYGWSKRGEEKARIELIKVLGSEWVRPITKVLDANTEAVKVLSAAVRKSTEHNEQIIENHLSGQAERDKIILDEMRSVVAAIQESNRRRRAGDS